MDLYYLVLLETLNRHRAKFQRPRILQSQDESDNRPWKESNFRQRFEVGLLQILERNLEAADIKSLPPTEAADLERALGELIQFLNTRANEHLELGDLATTIAQHQFRPKGVYPRLEKLLSLLGQSPGPFEISGPTNRCIFIIHSEDHAETAHTLVRKVNAALHKPALRESKDPSPLSTNAESSTDNAFDRWFRLFDREYRELVGKMLDSIKSDFEACEKLPDGSTAHEVRIQLPDIGSYDVFDPKMTVAVFLLCKPNTWQGVRCRIDRTLQDEIPKKPRMCTHLESSLRDSDGLVLLFHENLAIYTQDSEVLPFIDPEDYEFETLEDLIGKKKAFKLPPYNKSERKANFKHPERRALAAKLALHLALFCPWKHSSNPWNSQSIHFVDLSSNDHNRATPYISCNVKHDSSTASEIDHMLDSATLAQTFTTFARILLEIEYGQMPDHETVNANNLRRRVKEYFDQWSTYGNISQTEYLAAIDACLGFHRAYEKARLLSLGNSERAEQTYRRLIRTQITSRIIADLPGFKPPEEKRARSAPFQPDPNDSLSDRGWPVASSLDNVRPLAVSDDQTPRSVPSNPMDEAASTGTYIASNSHSEIDSVPVLPSPNIIDYAPNDAVRQVAEDLSGSEDGWLQDDENDLDSVEYKRRATDKWFTRFTQILQKYKVGRTRPRLKVAVLDSGINISHADFDGWDRDRIKKTVSFIGDNPEVDNVGHGTHIAAILLRLTENVDLYIGKITNSTVVEQSQEVANAIKYARTEWKVDMISLSFGFSKRKGAYFGENGISKEISRCFKDDEKKILVFASASNDTREGWRTWPAQEPGVICVHSAKHWGGPSDFNPPPEGGDNFSFVGEEVRPTWGRRELQDPTNPKFSKLTYKSGTSYATPVAVSVAAFIIGYIKLNGWSNWQFGHDPLTPEGMQAIFKLMSRPVAGYDRVSPTRYLNLNSKIDHVKTDFERALDCQ